MVFTNQETVRLIAVEPDPVSILQKNLNTSMARRFSLCTDRRPQDVPGSVEEARTPQTLAYDADCTSWLPHSTIVPPALFRNSSSSHAEAFHYVSCLLIPMNNPLWAHPHENTYDVSRLVPINHMVFVLLIYGPMHV